MLSRYSQCICPFISVYVCKCTSLNPPGEEHSKIYYGHLVTRSTITIIIIKHDTKSEAGVTPSQQYYPRHSTIVWQLLCTTRTIMYHCITEKRKYVDWKQKVCYRYLLKSVKLVAELFQRSVLSTLL